MSNPPPPPPPPRPESFPPEIERWNWGAFLLSWAWAIRHRVWVGLWALVPIPVLWLAMSIALGVKGNRWAWHKRHDQDLEAFRRTQRRWAWAGAVFWIVVIPLSVWALIASSSGTETVASADGGMSLKVPETWQLDEELHSSAEIAASNRLQEMYVIVLSEDASALPDGTTSERYSELAREALVDRDPAVDERRVGSFSIDGHEALEYEIRGVAEGLEVVWLHTTVRTDDQFVQVIAWTMASSYQANVETLQEVIRSFRSD